MEEEPKNPRFRFEPLDKNKHDRAAFFCGEERLDIYLKEQAAQDLEKRVAAVIVATPDGNTIAGFYTLSQYSIHAGELPPEIHKKLKLPKYPELPATLLGRLARSTAYKGDGVGELLLMSAMEKALTLSRQIASVAIVVDAKDDLAKKFYSEYGFIELPEYANRMFIPMKTVEHIFH